MTFESLLGGWVAESDLTRRWDIMLPEGDVVVLPFVLSEPAILLFSDGLLAISGRLSVGVGGVTCVSGASSERFGGVLGSVTIVGTLRMLVVGLLRSSSSG